MSAIIHLRLSELNRKISDALSYSLGNASFWVVADITNHSFQTQKNYHSFELVEKDPGSNDIIAKISGKAWSRGSQSILQFEKITGQRFTNNISVLLNVSVQFHAIYGLQVSVNQVDPNFTLGVLEQHKQATLDKLVNSNPEFIQRLGDKFITRNNQLKLPTVIQKIAVISSKNSAGGEDFRHTLLNNPYAYVFDLDYFYTEVQGEVNADQLLKKLVDVFNSKKPYDAVVVTRGGGSQTDFLIFDNYQVGRAAAKFPIPIITGIGHQKNETILDLMVHTQTKTPTKAAEFIISHNRFFEDRLMIIQHGILIKTQQLFSMHFQSLSRYSNIVVNNTRSVIANRKDKLSQQNQRLVSLSRSGLYGYRTTLMGTTAQFFSGPKIILNNLNRNLSVQSENIKIFQFQLLKNQSAAIRNYISLMKMMSPANILTKGFAIVKADDKIISSAENIFATQVLDIILADSVIKTKVVKKSKYDGSDFNV